MDNTLFAPWREIKRETAPPLESCLFYHSMRLPSGQDVRGMWDLRPGVDAYLGRFDFSDLSVLEVGPASGFLSWHMESRGAQVTSVEPSMTRLWDAVPLAGFDVSGWRQDFAAQIECVRNAFWYMHHAVGSHVRLIETDVERLSPQVGVFDVAVCAAVLLHCRSPFSVLEGCARAARHALIVTDLHDANLGDQPVCKLLPYKGVGQVDTWWALTPAFVVQALAVLGFDRTEVTLHHQKRESDGADVPMFTVVGKRGGRA